MDKDKFMRKMTKHGIQTGIHYKPVHQMSYYKTRTSLPITERIGKEIVSIPTHPNLTNDNVNKIIHTVNSCMRNK